MMDYMENTAAVIQNLEDAGCDGDTVQQFMELAQAGEKKGQFRLLEKHRSTLLDNLHKNEKQIDCLDYLIYQMRKEGNQWCAGAVPLSSGGDRALSGMMIWKGESL